MRIQLLFTDLVSLYKETDEMYTFVNDCAKKTKEIADELNFKKKKNQEVKLIEQKIKMKKNILKESISVNHNDIKHSFRNHPLKNTEYCIVCNNEMVSTGMKCSSCLYYCHPECQKNVKKACNSLKSNDHSSLASVDRIFIERINDLKAISHKKEYNIDLLLFNDGILLISHQESSAIEYLKFYSKMTNQFCSISNSDIKGSSSFTSFTITSARFQSLKYEILFSCFNSCDQ